MWFTAESIMHTCYEEGTFPAWDMLEKELKTKLSFAAPFNYGAAIFGILYHYSGSHISQRIVVDLEKMQKKRQNNQRVEAPCLGRKLWCLGTLN